MILSLRYESLFNMNIPLCFLCNMEVDVILPISLTPTYYHLGIFWGTPNVHGEQNQDISGGSPMTVKLFGRKQ